MMIQFTEKATGNRCFVNPQQIMALFIHVNAEDKADGTILYLTNGKTITVPDLLDKVAGIVSPATASRETR